MKQTIYSISSLLGAHRIAAAVHRRRPVVLTFHGVTPDSPESLCNFEGLHLQRSTFARLMGHLAGHYRVVPVASIVDWLEGGAELPDHAVAVTFDDGFRNVLTDAAPVLKRFGMPATLFVSTDFVFERSMLWPDRLLAALELTRASRLDVELAGERRVLDVSTRAAKLDTNRALNAACKQMAQGERLALVSDVVARLGVDESALFSAWEGFRPIDPDEMRLLPISGITVGAHTCSHPILALLSPAEQARELAQSRQRIESATGMRCDQFAYPNGGPGDFSAQTRQAVIDAGYRCAFTTIKRRVEAGDDRYEIPRCTLTHNRVTVAEFSAGVSGFTDLLRALRDRPGGRPPRDSGDPVSPSHRRVA